MKLLSIIVPVYNAMDYFPECIESIRKSTYTNLQIILVDDGSSDGSSEYCDSIALNDPRIIVIHKKNGGQSSARNVGLNAATGSLITFIDNDDWVDPEMYEELISNLEKEGCSIAGCATMLEYEGENRCVNKFADLKDGIYQREWLLSNILDQNNYAWGTVWNKVFTRELFDAIRFPEGMQLEDYLVITELFYKAEYIYFNSKPMYHWRQRSTSQSKRVYFDGKLTIFESINRIEQYITDNYLDYQSLLNKANAFYCRVAVDLFWDVLKKKPEVLQEIISKVDLHGRSVWANIDVKRKIKYSLVKIKTLV